MDERIDQVVERMGRIFDAKQSSRTAGRLFGLLLLAERPQTLEEIATNLSVSRASVSTEARRLEAIGLIELTTRAGDRRDYYLVPSHGLLRMIQGHLAKMSELRQLFDEALTIPGMSDAVRKRVSGFSEVHQVMQAKLNELLDEWHTQEHSLPAQPKKS